MGDSVQFLFQLDAKAPGMDKLLMQLGQSSSKLKESHGLLKHEEEGFKGVGHAVEEVSHKLKEMQEFLGLALAFEIVEKLTDKFTELAAEIVNTASKAESLQFSLDVNFGSAGKEMSEFADDLAKKTPFSSAQLKGWTNELGRAGVAAKDMKRYVYAALDVVARSSNKPGAMEDAVGVFERMVRTGKVKGNTLAQLAPAENFRFLPGFEHLSKQKIFEKLAEKDLNPEQVFRAITGGKPIGDVGADMQGLLDTKLKNLKTLPEQYYEKSAESPAMAPFKQSLSDLYAQLDPASENGQRILKSFNDMLMTVVDGIKSINFKELAADISAFVNALKDLAPVLGGALRATGSVIHLVTPAAPKGAELEDVHKQNAKMDIETDTSFLGRLRHPFHSFAKQVGASLGAEVGENVTDGVVQGVQAGQASVKDAGAHAGAAVVEGAAGPKGIDAHSPSKKFEQLGKWANLGFARGVSGSAGAVSAAVRGVFSMPANDTGEGAVPGRRARSAPAAGPRVSFGDVQVHVQHGGREEGEAAGAGFMASVEARIIALLQRKTLEEGGA